MTKSRVVLVLFTLALVVGLPLAGRWARRAGEPHCEFDGQPVEAVYRVRVVDRAGAEHVFCCVRCAGRWLARQSEPPRAVFVIDEETGAEIDPRSAIFVESAVVTNAVTGNHVHVFHDHSAAEAHARAFGGAVLSGGDRPLQAEDGAYPEP